MVTVLEVFEATSNTEKLQKFLVSLGLIQAEILCEECGSFCPLRKNAFNYACRRTIFGHRCDKRVNALRNYSFLHTQTIRKKLQFYSLFSTLPISRSFIMSELNLGPKSFIEWSSQYRQLCQIWSNSRGKIGGSGKIVEIGESQIIRNKYKGGKEADGFCVFGGCQRDTKDAFVLLIEDRDLIIGAIREYILPGTIIISNKSDICSFLNNDKFMHYTLNLNEDKNYTGSTIEVHIRNLDKLWKELRVSLPKYSGLTDDIQLYLDEFVFKRSIPYNQRIGVLFETAVNFYAK